MLPCARRGVTLGTCQTFASKKPFMNHTTHIATQTKEPLPAHLKRLEAESIEIIRDVAAEFRNPVMLYSIGKDSSVMLHLAIKAFYPVGCRFRCCTSTRPGSSVR